MSGSSPPNTPDTLRDFPVVIQLPVQWGDQDAFGHVNNTVYLRWCESARISYFDQTGMAQLLRQHGLGPILASITCNFRKQVEYPDTVLVGARVVRIGRSSLAMEHAVFSVVHQSIVADCQSVVVAYSYEKNQSAPVPDDVRSFIASIDKNL